MAREGWTYEGREWHTGAEVRFNVANGSAAVLDWIAEEEPVTLVGYPSFFEELALENGCQPLPKSVQSLIGVGGLMTPEMRDRVEGAFGVPVDQSYGLREAGFVAFRCRAGRYHVQEEHVVVEIVDEKGKLVAPGETGRLVVTPLNNRAMPLLRYDTGDLAIPADGPCPCGRTLQSFSGLVGRYRRFAQTPPGTRERVNGLMEFLQTLPAEEVRHLRRYRLHQSNGGFFELVLEISQGEGEPLSRVVAAAWEDIDGGEVKWPLKVSVREPGEACDHKWRDFTSDYHEH